MNCLQHEYLLRAVSAQANLPPDYLEPSRALELVGTTISHLKSMILGQEKALSWIEDTLKSSVSRKFLGWKECVRTLTPTWEKRPLATILALGPTGVGKSETAKIIAESFFQGRLIQLNGSDVGPEAPHGIATWVGSPPGYVGYDQGGLLTDGLRLNKSVCILADELEKASPEAFQNILLPLLGEGTVTDRNNGETLYATDCIIIATSNIKIEWAHTSGVGFIKHRAQDIPEEKEIYNTLSQYILPELIGRFNAIITYSSLSIETKLSLFTKRAAETASRIGEGTSIEILPSAQDSLRKKLEACETGARGVNDIFNNKILPHLITIAPGSRVFIDSNGNDLIVTS